MRRISKVETQASEHDELLDGAALALGQLDASSWRRFPTYK
jgi:hypothetical protein